MINCYIIKNKKKIKLNNDFNYYLKEVGKQGRILLNGEKYILKIILFNCHFMVLENKYGEIIYLYAYSNELLKCSGKIIDYIKFIDNNDLLNNNEFIEVFI